MKKVFELRTEELAVLIYKTSSDLEFLVSLMHLKDAEQICAYKDSLKTETFIQAIPSPNDRGCQKTDVLD